MKNESKPSKAEKPAVVPEPPRSIAFQDRDLSKRYEDVYEWRFPDEIVAVKWRSGAYEFICESGVALRIQIVRHDIIRVRYSPDGDWDVDFSYAINPEFEPSKIISDLKETKNEYTISTDTLQVVVAKTGMKVRIFNHDDQLLHEDEDGFAAKRTIMNGWNELTLKNICHRKTLFYGLGDKSSAGANLHGRKFENWCTDAYAFGRESDPLYRAIPFYYVVQSGVAHGIFLDVPYRTTFDFNTKDEGVTTLGSNGGEINFYFIYGPDLQRVAQNYHQLTGAHDMPPVWVLGFHQCRWSYFPDTHVVEIADKFRSEKIPCDALYLDIDYMDGFRCFTWNEDYFPQPDKLVSELRSKGFQTVIMIDPGLKEDSNYAVYQEGKEKGFLLKDGDGKVAKAPVWPGFCGFPDFTHPGVREWWGKLHTELYTSTGISGFWNDMNEPAVFYVNRKTLPDNVLHYYEGYQSTHKKAHNIYGMQMTRASTEGLKKLKPEKRPFLLTRATYAGGQRYAAVWTGDNCSTWEHLQIANIQCQRLSMSGFSLCGTDIGGFAGDPDGELFTRWLQLSVFHPVMRTHSMGQHTSGDSIGDDQELLPLHTEDPEKGRQEPWSFGEKWTQVARTAIELRYCLIPAIYTALWRMHKEGIPVIRHLVFENASDPKLWNEERDFLFGDHLLVSPVIQPKVQRQMVYLPKGNWYYFWSGQQCNGEVFVNVGIDQIPFFVREGTVLVTYPVRQHTGEPVDEITLYCYHKNGTETSYFYEDEGEGMGYLFENHALITFETTGDSTNYTLNMVKKGLWSPVSRKTKIYLIGFPTFAHKCVVDGVEMPVKEIRLRDRSLYSITTDTEFTSISWHA